MGDDDTTSGPTDTTTPTDFSQLHPHDGDPTGIDVGRGHEDIVGGTLRTRKAIPLPASMTCWLIPMVSLLVDWRSSANGRR